MARTDNTPRSRDSLRRRRGFAIITLVLLTIACDDLFAECLARLPELDFTVREREEYLRLITPASVASTADVVSPKLVASFSLGVSKPVSIPVPSGPNVVSAAVAQIKLAEALDDLTEKGYLAVRLPHAPPNFLTSTLTPLTITVNYQRMEDGELFTLPISLTRRSEYEPLVNTRYPMSDTNGHWEVWWLAPGDPRPQLTLPLYFDPFLTVASASVVIEFPGTDSRNCAGCPLDFLLQTGRGFIGPYRRIITLPDEPPPNPKVTWNDAVPCSGEGLTFAAIMRPGQPTTATHCLSNLDTVTRTFAISHTSQLGWRYDLFRRLPGDPPAPLIGPITVGPKQGHVIEAVLTATQTLSDTGRDTLALTATSVVSPAVNASIATSLFGARYALDEPGGRPSRTFVPGVRKDSRGP